MVWSHSFCWLAPQVLIPRSATAWKGRACSARLASDSTRPRAVARRARPRCHGGRHRVCTSSPHRLAAAAAVQDAGGRGARAGCSVRTVGSCDRAKTRDVAGVAPSGRRTRRRRLTMEFLVGKDKDALGKRWTDHEFIKRKSWRCRGD
jgi:hypothetical protein